jgi:hypothetical protein
MNIAFISGLAAASVLAVSATVTPAAADALSSYRWNKRVLVVAGPAAQNADVMQQRRAYDGAAQGMRERDVVLVEATGDSAQARQIRQQLSLDGLSFKVILVGKDGHTTIASDRPWTADDLFRRIDTMPMRRDEMRRKG